MKGGVLCARGRERPGALSFKLGPGSHYLPNQHSHNIKQQTNSGLLRTPYARRNRELGGGGGCRETGRNSALQEHAVCMDDKYNGLSSTLKFDRNPKSFSTLY